MAPQTAVIVIVGDEVLAGHTHDTNSHWIAARLRANEVDLLRIETIPDDVAEIEATVRRILIRDAPTFLFVVGGIGPTPDDRTYEGVGRALGVRLEVRPEHVAGMKQRIADRGMSDRPWADPGRSEAMRRMIAIPAGSQALANPIGAALGCVAEAGPTRVVVLPGVPREMEAMMDQSFTPAHLSRPGAPSRITKELEIFAAEAELWDLLNAVEVEFPDVRLGSYPQDQRGRVILRVSGPAEPTERAYTRLKQATKAYEADRREKMS